MKDIPARLARVAAAAERTKDLPLRRPGRPNKAEGEVGQVYSIRIPVDKISELEAIAAARGQAPRSMLREWVLDRLSDEGQRTGRRRKPPKAATDIEAE